MRPTSTLPPPPSRTSFISSPLRAGVRPEVQALRAFAVLSVVVYHLWPELLPGGYAGVDVFFVISGFLITSHLLREVDATGRIGLARFWARRARRLLPASFLVVLASAAATVAFAPLSLWQQYFREFGASALYVINWVLASDSIDYLAASNSASPVQHYWSLAVEEQFYLVWPLLILLAVLLASRLARVERYPAIGAVLGAVTAASFAYSVFLTIFDPAPAYFVTPVRAWEFGVGSLLGLATMWRGRRPGRPSPATATWRAALSWTGFAMLAATVLLFTSTTPFPGWTALLPAAGTLAVIWAGFPRVRWAPSAAMNLRPVQWLGDISYSLYLWHWPLVIFAPFVLQQSPGLPERMVLLAASLALAWLTKLLVEDPVRTSRALTSRRPRLTLGLTAACMVLIVGGSGAAWVNLDNRYEESIRQTEELIAANPNCFGAAALDPGYEPCKPELTQVLVPLPGTAEHDKALEDGCRVSARDDSFTMCTLATGKKNALAVALVGDSHAEPWAPALTVIAEDRGWQLDTFLKSGCNFSTSERSDQNAEAVRTCSRWNDEVRERIVADGYDLVVTSSSVDKDFETDRGESNHDAAVDGFVEQWQLTMRASDVRIVAIRDVPHMPFDVPECLSRLGDDVLAQMDTRCSAPQDEALPADPQVDAGKESGVPVIDLTQFFCPKKVCLSVIGSVVIYRDTDHMGGTYSRTLAPYLLDGLDAALLTDP